MQLFHLARRFDFWHKILWGVGILWLGSVSVGAADTAENATTTTSTTAEVAAVVNTSAQYTTVATITGESPAWSRDADALHVTTENVTMGNNTASIEADVAEQVAVVQHTGEHDWAIRFPSRIDVKPGEFYRLRCDVLVQGEGCVDTGVTLRGGANGEDVKSWIYGGRSQRESAKWQTLDSEFLVPRGATSIEPRLTGTGPATIQFRNYTVSRSSESLALDADQRRILTLENPALRLEFSVKDAAFTIFDRRTNRTWRPRTASVSGFGIAAHQTSEQSLTFEMIESGSGLRLHGTLVLDPTAAEYVVSLRPQTSLDTRLDGVVNYPYPLTSEAGDRVILPMNEGISFPVEEDAPNAGWLHTYGGHGLCMAFFGVVKDTINPALASGYMAILETPDDAAVLTNRIHFQSTDTAKSTDTAGAASPTQDLLCCAPQWVAQKGSFGYERKIRYIFLDAGGHVAICKRYREYAKQIGLCLPFTEKVKRNPALKWGIDRLLGAANIWCWENNRVELVRELQAAGIERILWSGGGTADEIAAMNELPNVLTSRYDIYQDIMDPSQFSKLPGVHSDWVTAAWPNDIVLNADGSWRKGWEVTQKDPTQPRIPCAVICDSRALPYAEKRIGEELKTKPYHARFLDTTVAAPWQDCYHPDHPMTRTDSKRWKMRLLGMMGEKFQLVCGSETGHEASVPFCDFYEGMMSLGPYRVPESGREMMRKWDDVPQMVEKYQLGETYRLPLWELVYHDCTVSYWYWGDYNNKLPSLWAKRDQLNALYGVPPMYMFTRAEWQKDRERFVASYRVAEPVSRLTGDVEMTDHRILTADRTVQRTIFANGVTVTVNFGEKPYTLEDGKTLAPTGVNIESP